LHAFSEPSIEALSADKISGATNGPGKAEHKDWFDLSSKNFNLLSINFLDLSFVILFKEAIKKSHN
jgi:hypothetical protein